MKVAVVVAMLATACAHSAYAGTVTLFAAKDCKGESLKLTASNSDLEAVKFDNKTNSTLVADGNWAIFTEPSFEGKRFPGGSAMLKAGACVNVPDEIVSQGITSARLY